MVLQISEIATNVNAILASLTVLFPGILAYFIYIGIRAVDFEEIKRSHLLLILVFTLFFEIVRGLSGALMNKLWFSALFFLLMPILLGVVSDISHRLFVTSFVDFYQKRIVDPHPRLKLIDVGNVPRWQKTISDFVGDSLGDVTKDYYTEVEIDPESEPIRGFLNGYSENDIELIRYDDLTRLDFDGVGDPDINPNQLTSKIEIIPKEKIISVKIYRVKMEDFRLE